MENKVSKRVVLSAFNTQLNHLTEAAGFCDFLLEQDHKTNPFLSEDDYTSLTKLSTELYTALYIFGEIIAKISAPGLYENKYQSCAED